ncbi:Holliday junction resolvase [Candidatus Woesearchaeota archaeon]|nr:Holliday junction resolvase [Candidatus Woesearchaeota archaeon]
MSRKSKGLDAERELIHKFWKMGWAAIRCAGSGSIKYPVPDVLAGSSTRQIAIECKTNQATRQYFTKKEIFELKQFSEIFGSESWVAIKFPKKQWFFINPEDLDETENSYVISIEKAQIKGLLFEEMIS